MAYKTIKKETEIEFTEKKSTFIGSVKRVFTEEDAISFIEEIKNRHKGARHYVYAYSLGENENIQRYSDDGEPQGTGGIPVLETIKKNNLRNTVVVVTRYFGGILLGTGGLARAYSRGARDAIDFAGSIDRVSGYEVDIEVKYEAHGSLEHYLRENSIDIVDIKYTDVVNIIIFVETIGFNKIYDSILDITSGDVKIVKSDESLFYKDKNKLLKEIEG